MDPLLPFPPRCPFWSSRVTLGRVRGGAVTFSNRVADKKEALAAMGPGIVLFVAWTGSYSTDLFAVTSEDAAELLAAKMSTRG